MSFFKSDIKFVINPFAVPDTLSFSDQEELLTIIDKAANDTNIIREAGNEQENRDWVGIIPFW
ncbi:hypothetical protein [Oceanobacillus oncorhynchi]|uniref:hypothetical protein n=1 Tax=Oceanobacillus oncorhynchi TaxID=545501 RepID=UPI0005ABF216|nr:hypothetical protein [Oceanobacillus oncorhynchi]